MERNAGITDLTPISNLTSIETLDIYAAKGIKDLKPIAGLFLASAFLLLASKVLKKRA